jgi:hypothetical protein
VTIGSIHRAPEPDRLAAARGQLAEIAASKEE